MSFYTPNQIIAIQIGRFGQALINETFSKNPKKSPNPKKTGKNPEKNRKKSGKNPANKSEKNTQIKLEITLVKCKTTKTC